MADEEKQGPQQVNPKAIAALVLGITSIVIPYIGLILGIIGIVFSNKANAEVDKLNHSGKGLAVAGLVTSVVGTVLWAFVLILVIIGFSLVGGH
ncbi:DUF4190 domain-containing protein [Radiobacillus kanasensis]|uniref:DUF4190 domain-containing protein n=1 Tax=Radiobacillus kanasensis TaxID=2844358 RepID=UPI001E487EAA|nr:DUF4190 domain-containing protein [Radiobacillus kanasensis]UFT98537.1 DUF4190 domain-containing protein [Radiobacillus kanasensis]